jgi:Stage II sporulation protein E (SpoIIE)
MTGRWQRLVIRESHAAATDPVRRSGIQVLLGVLPFVVMAAVAVVDLAAGPGVGFLPLLSLGPALAAVSWRPAQTALIGGVALALCVLLAVYDSLGGSRRELIAVATVCGVTAAGVVASAARTRRERELADVRTVAEAAQRVVLRPVPREVSPVRLAVRYISATASARIGGDLYEVITAGGNVRLIVGDAQGKGLPAVKTAAAVLGAFREAAYEAADLAEIAMRIETSLQRQAADEEFVTAILAQIAAGGRGIEILNCGHPPPLLLSGAATRFIEPHDVGLPLGLAQLAVSARDPVTVPLGPGDQILFYTDGISEARDKSGDFYPLDRCSTLLNGEDPDAALDHLHDDVIRHVGHALLDDAAMLLIRHPGNRQATPGGQDGFAANAQGQASQARLKGEDIPAGEHTIETRPTPLSG